MLAAVGEDPAHLAVGLNGDGHPARREDELQRVGHLHDLRGARRNAVGVLVLLVLAVLHRGPEGVELGLGFRRQGRGLGPTAGAEQGAPVDLPHALFPVRQLAKRRVGGVALLRGFGRGLPHGRGGGRQGQHSGQRGPL